MCESTPRIVGATVEPSISSFPYDKGASASGTFAGIKSVAFLTAGLINARALNRLPVLVGYVASANGIADSFHFVEGHKLLVVSVDHIHYVAPIDNTGLIDMHLDVCLSGEGNYGVNIYRLILLQQSS